MACCSDGRTSSDAATTGSLATRRLRVCYRCPKVTWRAGLPWCGAPIVGRLFDHETCGCMLYAKAGLAGATCPFGRWPIETEDIPNDAAPA